MISKRALGGYLLEDVLAALMSRNGYQLLRDESEDPDALANHGHGLTVLGRGARHQADALGTLMTPTPFSHPVRLFVEAKNVSRPVGLPVVRNAHGVVHDVNEFHSAHRRTPVSEPPRRFLYRYALFATSGFSVEAQDYALAHQISLIDLSGPSFDSLRMAIDVAASQVIDRARDRGLTSFSTRYVRAVLRHRLHGDGQPLPAALSAVRSRLSSRWLDSWAKWVVANLDLMSPGGQSDLVLGFPQAPFVLVMKPVSSPDLQSYVALHGTRIRVNIGFGRDDGEGNWTITPVIDPTGFELGFGLPGILEQWLLEVPHEFGERARLAKQSLMSTVYMYVDGQIVQLEYEPVVAPSSPEVRRNDVTPETGSDLSRLRAQLSRPTTRHIEPVELIDFSTVSRGAPGWTATSVGQLMDRLADQAPLQRQLIVAAAANGGLLTRDDVYEIAEFDADRTLRGLTRAPRRIKSEMVRAGVLGIDAPDPFDAVFAWDNRASHFVVPPAIVAILNTTGGPATPWPG